MDYGNLKVPENVTPEVQDILDSYEARNKEIENAHRKNTGRIWLGSALSGASAHPILNVPYVGTGLGGALYELGQGITEGDKLPELAKRTGTGFAIGETVGAIPYAGKYANKLSSGKIGNAFTAGVEKIASTPLGQKVTEIAPKVEDVLLTDVKYLKNPKSNFIETTPKSEVFYTPWNTEVIKNPTNNQKRSITMEYKKEFPEWINDDAPAYRTTYDKEGNEYAWRASDAIHNSMEGFLRDNLGVEADQSISNLYRDEIKKYRSNPKTFDLYSTLNKSLRDYEHDVSVKGFRGSFDNYLQKIGDKRTLRKYYNQPSLGEMLLKKSPNTGAASNYLYDLMIRE